MNSCKLSPSSKISPSLILVILFILLLAHGRWFSPGTPASSTTKAGRHDIAEILLKVALNTKNQIKSNLVYHN
jgi:hypothetical protein